MSHTFIDNKGIGIDCEISIPLDINNKNKL